MVARIFLISLIAGILVSCKKPRRGDYELHERQYVFRRTTTYDQQNVTNTDTSYEEMITRIIKLTRSGFDELDFNGWKFKKKGKSVSYNSGEEFSRISPGASSGGFSEYQGEIHSSKLIQGTFNRQSTLVTANGVSTSYTISGTFSISKR